MLRILVVRATRQQAECAARSILEQSAGRVLVQAHASETDDRNILQGATFDVVDSTVADPYYRTRSRHREGAEPMSSESKIGAGSMVRIKGGTRLFVVGDIGVDGVATLVWDDELDGIGMKSVTLTALSPAHDADHLSRAASWALDLYRECQRDAEGDPWHEPGGAERRFIAKLREYAGDKT